MPARSDKARAVRTPSKRDTLSGTSAASAQDDGVRSLRSDVQALTSSTCIFSNSRDTTITGGTFTEIQGNQYIFHGHVTADILDHTSAEQASAGIDDLDFSDYRVLKYGDLRAISVPQRRDRSILLDDGHELQEYTVRIHNQTMTARTYRGTSALQSFKDDVKVILEHNFRHPHILQLFGLCSSSKVPTLVFHGDLKKLKVNSIGWNLEPRDELCRLFQIYEECQVAFCYLMQELQLHDSTCDFLTREGQFIDYFDGEFYALPININFSNCSCHLYVDNSQHLQVSIEAPLITRGPGFYAFYSFPKLSPHDAETIKTALLSRRTIPDGHHIDKKACLLAIYNFIATWKMRFYSPIIQGSPLILISPMRCVRAARLTSNRECRFTWIGWNVSIEPDIEASHITVENISWTRFMVPHRVSTERVHANIRCYSWFNPSQLYLMMLLSQSERIMSQIKLESSSFSKLVMALGMRAKSGENDGSCFSTSLSFQAPEAVYLFVQDLRDVDDVFEIPWFWAKDYNGLERLSPADMLVFGLGEPRQSRIFLRAWNPVLEDLRIFHEIFGFAPDSPNISHFLDLPVVSVEWDGDDNGPLTPWELLVWNDDEYHEELDRFRKA